MENIGRGRNARTHTRAPAWLRIGEWIARWLRPFRSRRPAILVLRPGSLGDALLFTGALRALRDQFPDHHIILVASARARPIFERSPHVDELLVIDEARFASTQWRERFRRVSVAARVFGRNYTSVIYPLYIDQAGWSLPMFERVAAEKKHCLADPVREEQFEDKASDTALIRVRVSRHMHEMDKAVSLLQAAGCASVNGRGDIFPHLHLLPNECDKARELCRVEKNEMCVTLCPGSRFRVKDWGVDNYAALVRLLGTIIRGKIVLLGGREDMGSCLKIEQQGRDVANIQILNLAGKLSVHEACAVISGSDLCIGNDTFGLHAAIAVGTPSVVLMWGGDGDRWAPWGDPEKHRMVRADVDCGGCRGVCTQPMHDCMERITVEMVLSPAMLRGKRGARRG